MKEREERKIRALPISVLGDKAKGLTRDISVSGVYFQTDTDYQKGSDIKMVIEFDGKKTMKLECEGTVVRVVTKDGKQGVGVRIHSRTFVVSKSGPKKKSAGA